MLHCTRLSGNLTWFWAVVSKTVPSRLATFILYYPELQIYYEFLNTETKWSCLFVTWTWYYFRGTVSGKKNAQLKCELFFSSEIGTNIESFYSDWNYITLKTLKYNVKWKRHEGLGCCGKILFELWNTVCMLIIEASFLNGSYLFQYYLA